MSGSTTLDHPSLPSAATPVAKAPVRIVRRVTARRHVAWLLAGIAISFLIPFVLADQLKIQKDVYYGLYGAGVLALCAGWLRDTRQSLPAILRRRWRLALGLGVVAAVASVLVVLNSVAATPHPSGAEFVGALLWRGLFYGAIDGIMLTAFPILVVFAAFAGTRLRERRRGLVAIGAVALVTSMLVTATYHLGYQDFRSSKVRKPVTGDLIWSAPVLATWNPIGAPISHAALHVTAVAHSYETDLFLPPH